MSRHLRLGFSGAKRETPSDSVCWLSRLRKMCRRCARDIFGCNLQFDFVPQRTPNPNPYSYPDPVLGLPSCSFSLLPKFKDQIDSLDWQQQQQAAGVSCGMRLCIVTLDQFGLQLHTWLFPAYLAALPLPSLGTWLYGMKRFCSSDWNCWTTICVLAWPCFSICFLCWPLVATS